MKLQTIALAAFLFTTVGTVAQVEVSTKKVTAQKTTAPFEGEIETIVVKKVDDAEITPKAQTEKDKKAVRSRAWSGPDRPDAGIRAVRPPQFQPPRRQLLPPAACFRSKTG